jgi:hypothetical protein
MTALRRLAVIGSVAAVTVTLAAAGASADELTDYLERSNQSTYSANRLVVSVWGGQTQITSSFVEHSQGMEIIQVDSTWSMVGNGTAMTMDDAPHGVAFMSSSEPISTDRYVVGGVTQVTHMGRTCELVRVMEGDTVRARLLVDVRTGAPLITESFTDDGRVFRRSSLQNFLAYRTYSGPSSTGGAEYDIVMPSASDGLPDVIFGYRLVDVSEAPGDSEQGFYSDGLFSFSLFVLGDISSVTGFETPTPLITDTGVYDLVTTAYDVSIHWTDTENQFVIVGDLPPDHATAVLAELPAPDARSTFAEWWHRLFG